MGSEAQASLADAIDKAIEAGEVTKPHSGAFQLGPHELANAEVDRWRKLRAIPAADIDRIALQSRKAELLRPMAKANQVVALKGPRDQRSGKIAETSINTRAECAKSAGVGERKGRNRLLPQTASVRPLAGVSDATRNR